MEGEVIPSRGAQGRAIWTFDRDQNAVCFGVLSVPEPGTQLDVSYRAPCP